MGYIKWVDSLDKTVKLILAIFVPILFVIYRVIKDAQNSAVLFIILDIFLGIVGWIMDIVNLVSDKPLFSWASLINADGSAKADKPADAPKAEEKPADAPKAEEKPAEAPKAEEKPAEEKKDDAAK
jgi:hypothetical protein